MLIKFEKGRKFLMIPLWTYLALIVCLVGSLYGLKNALAHEDVSKIALSVASLIIWGGLFLFKSLVWTRVVAVLPDSIVIRWTLGTFHFPRIGGRLILEYREKSKWRFQVDEWFLILDTPNGSVELARSLWASGPRLVGQRIATLTGLAQPSGDNPDAGASSRTLSYLVLLGFLALVIVATTLMMYWE